ncbi:MAG: CBS domain-containing protein [Nitrospirales bacterium]|nr:CBS domain-containing protein [Nitrospirales bacterium]
MSDQTSSPKPSTIAEYMHEDPLTIPINATLQQAAEVMTERMVGALLVIDDCNNYVGIVSEKRLTREGLAKGRNPETTLVESIMRKDPISVDHHQSAREAQDIMKANGVRHLVVKNGEKIIGILALSDLIRYYTDFFE